MIMMATTNLPRSNKQPDHRRRVVHDLSSAVDYLFPLGYDLCTILSTATKWLRNLTSLRSQC